MNANKFYPWAITALIFALLASGCSGILPEQVNIPPAQAVQSCSVGNPEAVIVDGKKYDCQDVANAMATLGAPTAQAPEPTAAPGATTAATATYSLDGQEYTSPQGDEYTAVWDANGWLHQSALPAGPQRVAHEVSFTINPGEYVFNGVECTLYLDEARAGDGGKMSVGYGNGLKFSVATADGGEAWARVACRKSEAGGFSIEWRP